MRRVIRTGLVLVAIAALAVLVAACGSTKTTTETSTLTTSSQTQPTTTGATTAPHSTTTTAAGPGSCGPNQAFSQVSHTCVNTNSNGNPCPAGQVPMADRPVCVKE